MTREEAKKQIDKISGVMSPYILENMTIECSMFEVSASDLRAIADILDQVSKEEVKP